MCTSKEQVAAQLGGALVHAVENRQHNVQSAPVYPNVYASAPSPIGRTTEAERSEAVT